MSMNKNGHSYHKPFGFSVPGVNGIQWMSIIRNFDIHFIILALSNARDAKSLPIPSLFLVATGFLLVGTIFPSLLFNETASMVKEKFWDSAMALSLNDHDETRRLYSFGIIVGIKF